MTLYTVWSGGWKFERSPVFNRKFWQWKYYIDTESVGGDAITIYRGGGHFEKRV